MLVMAGSLIDTHKKHLTFEEFEACDRELRFQSKEGNAITFEEWEFELFKKYLNKYSKKIKKVSQIV